MRQVNIFSVNSIRKNIKFATCQLRDLVIHHNGKQTIQDEFKMVGWQVDDCEYVRELYKDYNIYTFGFTYSMTNAGGNLCKEGQEIVITNYDVKGE